MLGIQKITVFVFVRRVFEVLLLAVAKQLPFGNVKPSSSSNEPTSSTSALGKAILWHLTRCKSWRGSASRSPEVIQSSEAA